jgi:hypothetical protein
MNVKFISGGRVDYLLVTPTERVLQKPRFWADLYQQHVKENRMLEMVNTRTCMRMWVDWDTINDDYPYNRTEQFHPTMLKILKEKSCVGIKD